MAPKKRVETPATAAVEQRTPTEIELETVETSIKQLEQQLQLCHDGINDLAEQTQKLHELEHTLQPKESEHKSILSSFNRYIDSLLKRNDSFCVAPGSNEAVAAPTNGVAAPLIAAAATDPATVADLEVLRSLHSSTRTAVISILLSVFDAPQTAHEKKLHEADRRPITPPPGAKPAKEEPKVAAAGDVDLTCPIGIDQAAFQEVLRLRSARLVVDKTMNDIQSQISDARTIIEKRRLEGASKILLRKLERQLEDNKKRMGELQRIRDEEEFLLRKSQSAIRAKSAGSKTKLDIKK